LRANTPELEELVLGPLVRKQGEVHRNEVFLRFREGDLTYGEVDNISDRMAAGFTAAGVIRGEHVAVMLPNTPDFLHVIFALAKLGAVAVPLNVDYRGDLLLHVLSSSDSSALVVDEAYLDRVTPLADRLPRLRWVAVRAERAPTERLGTSAFALRELLDHGDDPPRPDVGFGDLQAIMYTSGTTGPSKGVMTPHALALTCALDNLRFLDRWGKTIYCPLPLFHAAGLWDGVMAALLSGGSCAIVDRFSASRFWDDIRYFRAQAVMGVFSMIPILLNRPPTPTDTDHPLETFYMGKSNLDEAFHARFGVRSVETYTSTEAGIPTGSPFGEWRAGSCGQENSERFEVTLVDPSDREVGPGEPGEIVVRPRQPYVITTGYYGFPEHTAHCFRNMWFHTGDRAYRDEDGYFYFLDRMKDAIRRRGENIASCDLECTINLQPAVLEAAAFGIPSELEDEEVKVAVVLRPGASLDPAELCAFCAERLPGFMVPRYVEVVGELPRTPTNKVAKHELRAAGDNGITPQTWDREAARTARPA
jgi:carnitine-CoA ligase